MKREEAMARIEAEMACLNCPETKSCFNSNLSNECGIYSVKTRFSLEEALNMAISALEQKPCEDAVSRETALEKMADYVASGYAESVKDFEEYSKIICQLPSVTQKSGKWEDLHSCWLCSECGYETHIEHNFCPNCGAKMESEDRE